MEPIKKPLYAELKEGCDDAHSAGVAMRRLGGRAPADEPDSVSVLLSPPSSPVYGATMDFVTSSCPPFMLRLLQLLRALCRRWCPGWIRTLCIVVYDSCADLVLGCTRGVATLCPPLCVAANRWSEALSRSFTGATASAAAATVAAGSGPSRHANKSPPASPRGFVRRCVAQIWCGHAMAVFWLAVLLVLLLLTVYVALIKDPYYTLRLKLRVSFKAGLVERLVGEVKEYNDREAVIAALAKAGPGAVAYGLPAAASGLGVTVASIASDVRGFLEGVILSVLAGVYAALHRNAAADAAAGMVELLLQRNKPMLAMLGDVPIPYTTLLYNSVELPTAGPENVTRAELMLEPVRFAMLRCTHGLPTLARALANKHVNFSASETMHDAMWSAFADFRLSTSPAQPHCLARSQQRMPCADVGMAAALATADEAGGEAPATLSPPPTSPVAHRAAAAVAMPRTYSRVQALYERRRVALTPAEVASMYYDVTPALPVEEVDEWRRAVLSPAGAAAETSNAAWNASERVRAQLQAHLERFRRGAPSVTPAAATTGKKARPAAATAASPATTYSAVIMILAGTAARDAPGPDNGFTSRALPLVERNFLQLYPHYPVHIFYETRSPAPSALPPWTLRDVLRHSDVYTIHHGYSEANATRLIEGGGAGGRRLRVYVPPPPPVLVDSTERLPPMRAQQAAVREWFDEVAALLPSAPYVTFENIAPLFSTLPCGVTEDDVALWVDDPTAPNWHRRGYRQMCRFWARLVWRLPSLRMLTDSAEGKRAMAAYGTRSRSTGGGGRDGDDRGTATGAQGQRNGARVGTAAALPTWQYRYAYYLRLDTDSYLHRPLACDPFITMVEQRCAYGYNKLERDIAFAVWQLGSALVSWMDTRTEISEEEMASEMGLRKAGGEPEGGAEDVAGLWGRLSDPSSTSITTLVSATGAAAAAHGDTDQEARLHTATNATLPAYLARYAPPLPPLPPTWPWYNVYPEHSSTALSAAEKDVLRAYFYTPLMELLKKKELAMYLLLLREQKHSPASPLSPLPASYARTRAYNFAMYYNNFEVGTFALKNHPLYVSVVDYLDNIDEDDWTGAEREAAAVRCDQRLVQPHEVAGAAAEGGMNMYATPVYLLTAAEAVGGDGDRGKASPNGSTRCKGRRQHRRSAKDGGAGRGADGDANGTRTGERNGAGTDADGTAESPLSARDDPRDWRSGYLQYRWGDAPVHTFAVEAVMQREGWGVCAFTEDLGWYEHRVYVKR